MLPRAEGGGDAARGLGAPPLPAHLMHLRIGYIPVPIGHAERQEETSETGI